MAPPGFITHGGYDGSPTHITQSSSASMFLSVGKGPIDAIPGRVRDPLRTTAAPISAPTSTPTAPTVLMLFWTFGLLALLEWHGLGGCGGA